MESSNAGTDIDVRSDDRRTLARPVFLPGETVYSAIAPDERGIVTSYEVFPHEILYAVVWASAHCSASRHYGFELSRDPLYYQATR